MSLFKEREPLASPTKSCSDRFRISFIYLRYAFTISIRSSVTSVEGLRLAI